MLVVNTCAFIDSAKQESIDAILEMAQHKKDGACQRLIVTGCLAERYRDELRAEIPEIDAVLGTGEVPGHRQRDRRRARPAASPLTFFTALRRTGTRTRRASSAPAQLGTAAALRPTSTTPTRRACSRRRGTTRT